MSKPLPKMPKMRKIPQKSYAWAEDLLPDKYKIHAVYNMVKFC